MTKEEYIEEWKSNNVYFPVYNPTSQTYWLVPNEALEYIFTNYDCLQLGAKDYMNIEISKLERRKNIEFLKLWKDK